MQDYVYHQDDVHKYKKLLLLKSEYNELSANKIATNLLWLKQSYYDQGEKAGKHLAWRLKKIQSDRAIVSITLDDGENVVDRTRINNAFAKYYEHLYKSEYPENENAQNQFLDQLQFPILPEETKNNLDEKLSVEELREALRHMNSGKAPGPEGLPVEIYERFSEK